MLKRLLSISSFASISAILVCISGCTFYELREHPKADLEKQINKPIVLHYKDSQIGLDHVKFSQTSIEGVVTKFFKTTEEPDNSIHINYGSSAQPLEAHIYLDSLADPAVEIGIQMQIPFTYIHSVKLYDVNTGRNVLTYLAIAGGVCAIAGITVLIIELATKQSCPFIYAYNGKTHEFSGEIFSGAIYPNLERHDYLPLPSLQRVNGKYSLQITNEVQEIQHTNLMELCVVDHQADTRVLFDRNGKLFTLSALQPELSCSAPNGKDASVFTNMADSLSYITGESFPDQVMDSLVFTFNRQPSAHTAKLLVRAKNLFWLDFVYSQFLDLFGDKIKEWDKSREKIPKEKILDWCRKQGILLMVYVDEGKGWREVDYCNEVGPMALRDMVIPMNLSESKEGTIRVKLEFGARFWEIDYAAIDYSEEDSVRVTMLPAVAALDKNGADVLKRIQHDDTSYYDQPAMGDKAVVTFNPIPGPPNTVRTVFLHSKGYYDILRFPTGKADFAYLKRFKKPGEMVRFANNRLKSMNKEPLQKGN